MIQADWKLGRIFLVLAVTVAAGCREEEPVVHEMVRSIKHITVTEDAAGEVRRFSGIVEATDTADLSFSHGGTVRAIHVRLGETVEQGRLLAELDPEPLELEVRMAAARLDEARTELAAKQTELDRQDTLFQKGWVSEAALVQARTAHQAAASKVEYAQASVNIANRNLDTTRLMAPFDGVVTAAPVEAFTEVGVGQTVLSLNARGNLQVSVTVPETVVGRLGVGQPVDVGFAALGPDVAVAGRITEVGATATSANAYPLVVTLVDAPETVRAGMTAQITVNIGTSALSAFLVPLSALVAGEQSREAYVYRFVPDDADDSLGTVDRVRVRVDGVEGNLVAIKDGVERGDVLASAGVSFLRDGQRVRLLR